MLKINKIFILFIFSFLSFKSYSSLIWFCPNDTDFLNHSNLYYKWDNLAKDISVFKFYSGVIHDAPNDSLRLKAATLNKKNIKISIEIPALTTSSNLNNIEGFESKKYLKDIMEKLKTNKVKISFISLDEPLYYGLYKENIVSKEEFYKNIADSLSVVWSYYPNVSVVDIEPLSQFKNNYLENNYQDWLYNFYKYTGHHISTLHADLYWEGDFKSDVLDISPILKRNNIKLGIIINADKNNKSNDSYVSESKKNYLNFKKYVRYNPDEFIIQSWSHFPNVIIPNGKDPSHIDIVNFIKGNAS